MQPASSYLIFLLIPVILGIGLAGFGVLFVVTAIRAKKASQATQAWTTSIGRVISTKLNRHTSYSHDGPRTSYEPVVEYEYSVMGSPYRGQRVAFGADTFSRQHAQQVLDRYPQGSQVNVYYDPNQPVESVLERSAKGTAAFSIVGLIFIIVGIGIVCIGAGIGLLLLVARQ